MTETASPLLTPWSSFYVMTGSSAAALTGLMFVVITLVMSRTETLRRNPEGIATYSTPTVLHFCAALFFSAVLAAPWRSLTYAGVLIGLTSLYGVVYILRVMYRTTRLTEYVPDIEDWTWYTILPFVAYLVIFAGALALFRVPVTALFALGAGVVLLILIGIRNAWDIVTFIAVGGVDQIQVESQRRSEGDRAAN